MTPAARFILRDKLKETIPDLTDDVLFQILSELNKLGALVEVWDETSTNPIRTNSPQESSLPDKFYMVAPMWNGEVFLAKQGDYFVYKDSEGSVRVMSKSERDLKKKIAKYRK